VDRFPTAEPGAVPGVEPGAPPTGAARTVLSVCTRCNRSRTEAERLGVRAGACLHAAVLEALAADPAVADRVEVRPVACMSGCTRACTVALSGEGRFTLMFGDLDADAATAAEVVACAVLHASRPDGFLVCAERPERLRAGILARIPPPEWRSETGAQP
jgi:predicted metal-binding protein